MQPITTMDENSPISQEAKQKLESSSAHTKAALEATTTAAKAVSETVKKHAQDVFQTGKEHLGAAAKDLGQAASVAVGDLRGQARVAFDQASDSVKNFQGQSEEYIRSKPLHAVGIAFLVGLVLGLITRR